MDLFFPIKDITFDKNQQRAQAFLIQALLPRISSKDGNKIQKFFKDESDAKNFFTNNENLIQLSPFYGCDFESQVRFNAIEKRKDHIEFIQSLSQEQRAGMSPYVRLLLVPDPLKINNKIQDFAVPLSFQKSFDLDFFLNKGVGTDRPGLSSRLAGNLQTFGGNNAAEPVQSTSRGELAAIQSLTVDRKYNETIIADPMHVNMSFYFSSFDVFAHKPAIDKNSVAGFNIRNLFNFTKDYGLNSPKDLRYTELISIVTAQKKLRLVLEYGWNVSPTLSSKVLTPAQKDIINKFEKTFYLLTPEDHTINFNEDGSLILNVKYQTSTFESLIKAVNFKDGIYKNQDFFKKVEGVIKGPTADLALKLFEHEKKLKTQSNLSEKQATEQAIASTKAKLNQVKAVEYVAAFAEYLKKQNAIYKAEIETKTKVSVLARDDKRQFTLKLTKGKTRLSVTEKSAYTVAEIKRKIKERSAQQKKFKDTNIEVFEDEEIIKNLFDIMVPDSRNPSIIKFVLFKDILAMVVQLMKSLEADSDVPNIVMGNFAMRQPDGSRYWCNVGDIPIEFKRFKTVMTKFLVDVPSGSVQDLLHYFFQTVFPELLTTRAAKAAIPTISFPFFHFNRRKWNQNNSSSLKEHISLLRGDKDGINKFAKEYFSDSNIDGCAGCILIGQTPSLNFENSKIFVAKNVEVAKQTFLKDETKLLEQGIAKLLVGASNGVLQSLNFQSNGDHATTNVAFEQQQAKKNVPPSLLASTYSYTVSATLFGNRAYEFTNLLYIPAMSVGYSPRLDAGKLDYSDFEIGGLYVILSVTDAINLEAGTYTKTINANTIRRESELLGKNLQAASKETKKALEPDNEPVVNLVNYLLNNIEEIVNRTYFRKLTLAEANALAIDEQETDNRSVSELIQARRDADATAALEASGAPKNVGGAKQVDSDGVIRSTSGFVPLKTGIGSSF